MIPSLLLRLRGLVHRRRLDADLEAELAHHLAMKERALSQEGLAPAAAASAGRRAFGNTALWQENIRDLWRFRYLESLWSDLAYALRLLRKDKGFTLVAIFTLALGVGANTAIFSLLNGLIWRPLPVDHPEQIIRLALTNLPPTYREWVNGRPVRPAERPTLSYPMYTALEKRQQVFAGMFAGAGGGLMQLDVNAISHRAYVTITTGSTFPVLGLRAQAGRLFGEADDVVGAPRSGWVAVISDRLWTKFFARSSAAIGAQITIERVPFTIVGVAPASFRGVSPGTETEVWVPLGAIQSIYPNSNWFTGRSTTFLQTMARLRDGVTVEQARRHLDSIAPAIFEEAKYPESRAQEQRSFLAMKFAAEPAAAGRSWVALSYGQSLRILLAAVATVLLIAVTNLTNLFLARSTARRFEIAVRISLGAPAARIRRQFLLESGILALAGTAAGALAANWLVSALQAAASRGESSIRIDTSLDWRMLAFLAGILLAVVLLAGLAPAWAAARVLPHTVLKAHSGGSRWLGFRRGLIVMQTAFSILLLGGAGLMFTSLRGLLSAPTGFLTENSVFVLPDLINAGIRREQLPGTYTRLLSATRQRPNIVAAAWSVMLPFSGGLITSTLRVKTRSDLSPDQRTLFLHQVSDGYFAAAGVPLLAGRDLPPAESRRRGVCLLSETAARRFFGSPQEAIGRQLGDKDELQVIGVVAEAKYQNVREPAPPTLYLPYWTRTVPPAGMNLVVRYRGPQEAVLSTLQSLFLKEAGRLPYMQIHTIRGAIEDSLGSERLLTWLLGGFAGFALLISVTGLAGLLSYMVEQRRKDLGIRLALGATPRRIRREVRVQGLSLAATGLACGIFLSYLLRRSLDAYLFGIAVTNPAIWLGGIAALLAAALAATAIPAARAARVDPLAMLRDQ